LHTTDVDFHESKITITRVKGSLSGTYLMQPEAAKLVRSSLRSRKDASPYLFISKKWHPISRRRLDELITHYGREAKLPEEKQHFHMLRHAST
jgi:integrase